MQQPAHNNNNDNNNDERKTRPQLQIRTPPHNLKSRRRKKKQYFTSDLGYRARRTSPFLSSPLAQTSPCPGPGEAASPQPLQPELSANRRGWAGASNRQKKKIQPTQKYTIDENGNGGSSASSAGRFRDCEWRLVFSTINMICMPRKQNKHICGKPSNS